MPSFKYGLPFAGYNATIARMLIPRNQVSADSRDWAFDPTDGKWVRRSGSVILGDVFGSQAGILTSKHATTPKHLAELSSTSITNGYPIPGLLLTAESTTAGKVGFGTLAYYSTNASAWKQLLSEFGSTHYNNASGTALDILCDPLFYGHGDGGNTRGAFEFARNLFVLGARNVKEVGDYLYCGDYNGVPWKWKKQFNDASNSGTNTNRLFVMGHKPPIRPPKVVAGTNATSGPWAKNDQFFVSVAFLMADGSVSMPCLPRDINGNLAAGLGRITLTGGSNGYYTSVTWSNISKGPDGTVARVLLRSPKVDSSAATYIAPDISDLRVTGILWNNSQTAYADPNGNDVSLLPDVTRIRFDHVQPPPSRYIWTNDQHVFLGDLKWSPTALFIGPWEATDGAADINYADSETWYGSKCYLVRVTATNVEVTNIDFPNGDAATRRTQFALSGNKIQDISDLINGFVVSGNQIAWGCQIAPGADASADASNLATTVRDLTGCATNTNTTLTRSGGFGQIAKGMYVYGTDIPAGCYVADCDTGNNLTLSAAATGTHSGLTITFANNYGDDAIPATSASAADKYGWMRIGTSSLAAPLYFKKSAYLDTFPDRPFDVMFSGGDPGHATYAPNNFYVGNRRTAPTAWGRMMGGAGLLQNAVVLFSRCVSVFRNARAGKTGLDPDYRFEAFNEARGCVSPYSIVQGNGWVGYLTHDGYVICDAEREVLISLDPYQKGPDGTAQGEWSYEVPLCEAAASLVGGDDFGFKASLMGSQLHVSYRTASNNRRKMVYDFTPSVNASGLGQVLKPDGSPYPWGNPLTLQASVMGKVRQAGGEVRYMAVEGNAGSTGDGRVDQFDTGYQDNAVAVVPILYMAMDLCDTLRKKSAQDAFVLYDKNGTGLTLRIAKDKNRSSYETVALASSGTDPFTRKLVQLAQTSRSPREVIELSLTDDGSGSAPPKFWGVELEADVLASHT